MSSKKRILLIEDHDDSRHALESILRRRNFDVKSYDRCAPAEPHLFACDIDIALLDVRLPGRCGDDYGKELRQRCSKTMIVFLTGEAMVEPLKQQIPDCFVMRKPVDVDLLLELLQCFDSTESYGSSLSGKMDQRAGPGNMGKDGVKNIDRGPAD